VEFSHFRFKIVTAGFKKIITIAFKIKVIGKQDEIDRHKKRNFNKSIMYL
jgi:hypothetical protein